jgi:DNA-binding response OmpR family regulator
MPHESSREISREISRPETSQWHGGRVLVAEDFKPLGEITCDFLRHCGLIAIGPVASVRHGCRLAQGLALDGAVLDLKLSDDLCLPICRILTARRIPFMFLSGYCDLSRIPPEFREAPLVCKPFESDEMKRALKRMLSPNIVAADLLFAEPLSAWLA